MIKATADTSGTTCIIRAQDFSQLTTDDDRNRWTGGKMRHVLAAIGDAPVIITTDNQTGHTLVNVKLAGLRDGWSGNYELGITSTFEDGSGRTIWHFLPTIGDTIVPLANDGHSDAKWKATRSFNDEASHAVELAQAQHGKSSGREWGGWKAHVGMREVSVTYTPYPASYADVAPRGERGFWTYNLEECRAQGLMRQQRMHDAYPDSYEAPARRSAICDNTWHLGLYDFMACSECRDK